jgi:TatA/E family protein of Tat protein translocase
MFGPIGGTELLLILVIALIIFGPRKLPDIGKSMGRMMAEFRRASNEFKRTIEDEVEAEKMTPTPTPTPTTNPTTDTPPAGYDPVTESSAPATTAPTPDPTPDPTPTPASPEEPTVSRDAVPTPIEPR